MASLRKRGNVWYYRYTDADGAKHEKKGCSDRRETERMAAAVEAEAAKIRAGFITGREVAFAKAEARSLEDHLAEYHAHLKARGRPSSMPT